MMKPFRRIALVGGLWAALAAGTMVVRGPARADLLGQIILSGPAIPSWLPSAGGQPATVYADFAGAHYWYEGQEAGLTPWLAALGGTFSRSSSATYANSSGLLATAAANAVRFDFNPTTGAAQGLLLEGASTNIALESAFASGWIDLAGTTTLNAGIAPDGTLTAAQWAPGTGSSTARGLYPAAALSLTASIWTTSVWTAPIASGLAFASLSLISPNTSTGYNVLTNLATGAQSNASLGSPTNTGSAVVAYPASQYRASVTMLGATGSSLIAVSGSPTAPPAGGYSDMFPVFNGSGVAGAYVWGAQVENLPFPTSYIPTTSGSASRSADALSNPWSPGAVFTKLVKVTTPIGFSTTADMTAWAYDDGTASNEFLLIYNHTTGHLNLKVVSGGTIQATLDLGAGAASTNYTVAFAAQANSFRASVNGAAIVSAAAGSMPVGITTERYGASPAGNQWFGHVVKSGSWGLFANDNTLASLAASQ